MKKYYEMNKEEVFETVRSTEKGLKSAEAAERLKKYGYYIYQTNNDGNIEIYKSLISGKIITRKD